MALSCANVETVSEPSPKLAPSFSGAAPPASVRILVLGDVHGYDRATLVRSEATRDRHMVFWEKNRDDDFASTRAILAAAATHKPDLVVLPGDLTVDGEKASHELLARVLAGFEAMGIPAYVLPGNHDIDNPFAVRHGKALTLPVKSVDAKEFASIYDGFGYDEALSRDPGSLSYAVEPRPGLVLIALDTARWRENRPYPFPRAVESGALSPSTIAWLGPVLAEARKAGARIVVAQHHPPDDPDDPEENALRGSRELTSLCERYGVELIIAAHRHRYFDRRSETLPVLGAPSVASSPGNALLVELGSASIEATLDPDDLVP